MYNNHHNILRIKKRKWLHFEKTIKRVLKNNNTKKGVKKSRSVWKFKEKNRCKVCLEQTHQEYDGFY